MSTSAPDLSAYAWPAGTVFPPQRPAPQPELAGYADFGIAVASADIDDAVVATLQKWLPTYLAWLERTRQLSYQLGRPKSYASTVDDDQFLDRALPAVLVATARTQSAPLVAEDGSYSAPWLVATSAVVRGRTPAETRRTASLYELAVRMAVVQALTRDSQELGGPIRGVRWIGGGEARPLADPNGRGRWLGEGASQFSVFTDHVVQEGVGPTTPDEPDYGDLPLVTSVDVDVEGAPINPTGGS